VGKVAFVCHGQRLELIAVSPTGLRTAGDRLKIDRGDPVRLFRCDVCGAERHEGWAIQHWVSATAERAAKIRDEMVMQRHLDCR
jgi:hypothetical protein